MPLQADDMLHGQYQIRRGGFGLVPAEATMRLSHEQIARTHTLFLEDGSYHIVMERMAGDSLEFCLQPFCSPKKGGDHLRESAGRS